MNVKVKRGESGRVERSRKVEQDRLVSSDSKLNRDEKPPFVVIIGKRGDMEYLRLWEY